MNSAGQLKGTVSPFSVNTLPSALVHLQESISRRELVVVAGSGIGTSLSNGQLPSWKSLVHSGLEQCEKKGRIDKRQRDNWSSHLESNDLDELLGAAEFMARKLEAPKGDLYIRWLQDRFRDAQATNIEMVSAIRAINDAGIPICTLNYDTLLEAATGLQTITLDDTLAITEWMRGSRHGIFHLHGCWENSESCILSIRDYQTTLGNEVRDLIQRSLGSFRRLLFIGCGSTLSDPNFSALISWLRTHMNSAPLQHYALVRDSEVTERHADKHWHGFVEPIGFGDDYEELPNFLRSQIVSTSNKVADKSETPLSVDIQALDHYRRFITKDCGLMTIEGIKADMDTSKQKFDIERLFVPLSVLPCPPDIPTNDPLREEKLSAWQANSKPISFGQALTENKRLALLALPGGGKTMLLKRLAVAYAEPERRKISPDDLPEQPFFPILIRCREWRDHINSPILTLLKRLPDITGQVNLYGFVEAVLPLLQNGKVLLLIDGLDEIHNDSDRSIFVENVEKFLEEYPNTRLVTTSREAGFSLIAPCLNRFCEKFRVAPLDARAIKLLCHHWHVLMTGDSPDAIAEGIALATHMLETTALKRLAENPLLLTMLLVVKHGAGRLPPDRVSLYGRAVEVLLDTWNIKGHAALNLKESIPQLACVAFELMRQGKQTATESELLKLLDEARKKLPQIGRYAKDSTYDFLKRVELRSSLLLEAGHQIEAGQTVPFYQFRHLTFQEYLAAVAAANGHFIGYRTRNTVLSPLKNFLTAEEWKEVIPMAAVLAGKQSDGLLKELISAGKILKKSFYLNEEFTGKTEWLRHPSKLPAPIARLTQCLIEESEVPQEMLPSALELVALFAHGCRSDEDWKGLARGPYGKELLHQAWILYQANNTPRDAWVRNTCAILGANRFSLEFWGSKDGKHLLRSMVLSTDREEIAMGLLTWVGTRFAVDISKRKGALPVSLSEIEKLIFVDDVAIWHAAVWVWSLHRIYTKTKKVPTAKVLDRLLHLWNVEHQSNYGQRIVDFALTRISGIPRNAWTPVLSQQQRARLSEELKAEKRHQISYHGDTKTAAYVIAFHARDAVSDTALAKLLAQADWPNMREWNPTAMLEQLGKPGIKLIEAISKLKN
jgi:hypothetical protein